VTRKLYLHLDVDPRDLAINRRFKGKPVIHPRVREAMDEVVIHTKQAIQGEVDYIPCKDCGVRIIFGFPSRRSDIDGPLKRFLDAIQEAHKALDLDWNDNRISKLVVEREITWPGIVMKMDERDHDGR
jgi:Holliday junction resolvase RusA-like endonuclease